MTSHFKATLILPIILVYAGFCMADLNTTYQWKYIDYDWKSDSQKARAVTSGKYSREKIITLDVQPLSDGRVLVTTPRYFNNPASLSTISDKTGPGGPLLAPYPDWCWHTKGNCSGITSVDRVILDDFNRLWLVDSGRIGRKQVCPAKILAFNATTDELLKTFEIPNELLHNPNHRRGWLAISTIEINEESPEDVWVYISDVRGGLLIWDGEEIWRLDDRVYYPHPNATTFSVAGENFTRGFGLSDSGITPSGFLKNPVMIFQPTSSYRGYAVTIEDLHNSKSGSNLTYYVSDFVGPSQELERTYSKTGGIMIAGFPTETAVECWNLQYPLDVAYIANLAVNETTLQFVSAIKVVFNSDQSEELYVTSNRLQKFIAGTMNFGEINFRILTGNLTALIAGTVCEPKPHEIVDGIEDKAFTFLKTSNL